MTDKITLPAALSRVTLKHSGRRNFIVTVFYANGREGLLANKIGAYEGTRAVVSEQPITMEIQADGAWELTFEPMQADQAAAGALEGNGDYVSPLFQPASSGKTPYNFKHSGRRNFIVELHCAGGDDLAQNSIGPAEGSAMVDFGRGPCFWDVQADGDWSIGPK